MAIPLWVATNARENVGGKSAESGVWTSCGDIMGGNLYMVPFMAITLWGAKHTRENVGDKSAESCVLTSYGDIMGGNLYMKP